MSLADEIAHNFPAALIDRILTMFALLLTSGMISVSSLSCLFLSIAPDVTMVRGCWLLHIYQASCHST